MEMVITHAFYWKIEIKVFVLYEVYYKYNKVSEVI